MKLKSILFCIALACLLAVPPSVTGRGYGVGRSGELYRIVSPKRVKLISKSRVTMYDIAQRSRRLAYAVSSGGNLYRINLRSGRIRVVGPSGFGFNALDFRPGGGLVGMRNNSTFIYSINTGNGAATPLFNTGFSSDGDLGFLNRNIAYLSSSANSIVRIDLLNGTTKVVGGLGPGNWYGLDFRGRQLNVADGITGRYFRIRLSNGRKKLLGRMFPRRSPNYGVNGITL